MSSSAPSSSSRPIRPLYTVPRSDINTQINAQFIEQKETQVFISRAKTRYLPLLGMWALCHTYIYLKNGQTPFEITPRRLLVVIGFAIILTKLAYNRIQLQKSSSHLIDSKENFNKAKFSLRELKTIKLFDSLKEAKEDKEELLLTIEKTKPGVLSSELKTLVSQFKEVLFNFKDPLTGANILTEESDESECVFLVTASQTRLIFNPYSAESFQQYTEHRKTSDYKVLDLANSSQTISLFESFTGALNQTALCPKDIIFTLSKVLKVKSN